MKETENIPFLQKGRRLSQLYHFYVLKLFPINGKANECTHLLPTLQACRSGIDMEAAERFVVEDFENVAMSGNKKVGRTGVHLPNDGAVVVAGVTTDVLYQDISLFTFEAK